MESVKTKEWQLHLGAAEGSFYVWAPFHETLFVDIIGKGLFPMQKVAGGYFSFKSELAEAGDRYYYQLPNGAKRPDPVSRFLPEGVEGPTLIIDRDKYRWHDRGWKGLSFDEYIFYEVHIGAFSKEGTYQAVIDKLPYLKKLGITCLEIMPLAHFPGRCNWGYDGVSLYAPYSGYGSPDQLKELIDSCHQEGIAVCLDVVYNHLGPVGNYLAQFAPYFSKSYQTPWGDTFNYDSAYSDDVRHMMISNALYWLSEYHIDCLRLDAIHGIYDCSATHFLEELSAAVFRFASDSGRNVHLLAESDRNDSAVVRSKNERGYQFSGLWNDDFHHSLHTTLTRERQGYYEDFSGLRDLAKALSSGFVYDNKYSVVRKRHHGNGCDGIALNKFVIFGQNHDQVGNRPFSARLSSLISKKKYKLIPFLTLLTPSTPLLFMGEEYLEKHPFGYFVDFEEQKLMRSIYEGRKSEFFVEAMDDFSYTAFDRCKLSWECDEEILSLYTQLIDLRKRYIPRSGIRQGDGLCIYLDEENQSLAWEYESVGGNWIAVFCYFGESPLLHYSLPFNRVQGELLVSTSLQEHVNKKITFTTQGALVISYNRLYS